MNTPKPDTLSKQPSPSVNAPRRKFALLLLAAMATSSCTNAIVTNASNAVQTCEKVGRGPECQKLVTDLVREHGPDEEFSSIVTEYVKRCKELIEEPNSTEEETDSTCKTAKALNTIHGVYYAGKMEALLGTLKLYEKKIKQLINNQIFLDNRR